MRKRSRVLKPLVVVGALALLAAACGDDDDSSGGATTTAAGATTTAAAATTAARRRHHDRRRRSDHHRRGAAARAASARPASPTTPSTPSRARTPASSPPTSSAPRDKPLKAEGEPIVIGFQNPQGDPNGSFPEYTTAIEAAAKYINEELGGLGSNPSEGRAGRPIQLETCFMAINPADSQKCANELAGKNPFVVVVDDQLLRQPLPDLRRRPASTRSSASPITDRRLHRAAACTRSAPAAAASAPTPGSSTPPPRSSRASGSPCRGPTRRRASSATTTSRRSRSTSSRARCPATPSWPGDPRPRAHRRARSSRPRPDVTPQVTQVLDFEPDVIIFSAQGADCWNLVDGLGRLGWTPDRSR